MKTDNELFMSKITNYNCDGLCSERYCSKRYTHSFIKKLGNLEMFIPLCEEHAKEYEETIWEEEK